MLEIRLMTIDYGEICKTFHCGTAWRGNFPAEIVFSTSTMWRMELSVVWMVATGKLQYPLQKPVSSLSQTVIGGRKRFHLCLGFQFSPFLFYMQNSADLEFSSSIPKIEVNWGVKKSQVWQNSRCGMNPWMKKKIEKIDQL